MGDTETDAGDEALLTSGLDAIFRADHASALAAIQHRQVKDEAATAAGDAALSESRFNMTAEQDEALRLSMNEAALACRVARLDAAGQGQDEGQDEGQDQPTNAKAEPRPVSRVQTSAVTWLACLKNLACPRT
jgi:hypothetical protein